MFFPIAHLAFTAGVVVAVILGRRRPGPWVAGVARLTCAVAGLGVALAGAVVLVWIVGSGDERLGRTLLATLVGALFVLGGILLVAGSFTWYGERAATIRRAGLVFSGLGAFVPSTFSLLLLPLILVLPAMWSASRTRGSDGELGLG